MKLFLYCLICLILPQKRDCHSDLSVPVRDGSQRKISRLSRDFLLLCYRESNLTEASSSDLAESRSEASQQTRPKTSIPAGITLNKFSEKFGSVARARAAARSDAKGFLYSPKSCLSFKKKFEPMFLAKERSSSPAVFGRATFCACKAQFTNSLIGSSQIVPFLAIWDFFSSKFNFSSNNSFFFCL